MDMNMNMGSSMEHLNWLFLGGFAFVIILVILLFVYGTKMIEKSEDDPKE
ncbi:hypothetical protein DFP93_10575 [Aneurinibacillus soli]|uniref:Uncharacterized protein n=2 Tax=Aneurinibacillus soli TaxID=1500254 RepID=A0A0U5B275_9BACL|nr:hypothetical protein DFP93_10575 [Aneurinibacillus soli]BAU28690.1 hypothetical protein CB4_02865 [Aneurinibacillus soli]